MGKFGRCSCACSRDLYRGTKGAGYLEEVKWNWGAVGKWGSKERRVVWGSGALCLCACTPRLCELNWETDTFFLGFLRGLCFWGLLLLGPRIFGHARVNRARRINYNE